MSFSSDVKKELSNVESENCCEKAELYGIIRYKADITIINCHFGVQMITTQVFVAKRIISLFKKIYNVKSEVLAIQRQKLDFKLKYVITFTENEKEFLKDLGIINSDNSLNDEINKSLFEKPCCKGSLFRGLFISQGSINNPISGNYHLEMIINKPDDVDYLFSLLAKVGITPKVIYRKKGLVIYLKKAEQIGDFLKYIGAMKSLFSFEDIRIQNDYSNSVNRIINCDIHNEQRALETAQKQLKEIKYITDRKGIVDLSQRLLDAMLLRNKNPECSLSELSELSLETIGHKVTKSGLSHCFRDIHLLYLELRGEKK